MIITFLRQHFWLVMITKGMIKIRSWDSHKASQYIPNLNERRADRFSLNAVIKDSRKSLVKDWKCGINCLRHASQLSLVNGHKCIRTFLNQAPFLKNISFPPLADSLANKNLPFAFPWHWWQHLCTLPKTREIFLLWPIFFWESAQVLKLKRYLFMKIF